MDMNVKVCDVCRSIESGQAATYTISRGSETVTLDLCGLHAQPVEELMGLGEGHEEPKPAAAPTRRRRTAPRVTSIEEIEAMKKGQRRTRP